MPPANPAPLPERILPVPIEGEMRTSYVTYAMSVIISRALPDARDGLKPSQRRILVAMNDLNLGPSSGRVKCAKICGDTSGNYHPHGDGSIYPTLVRLAQNWNMRETLIDKQGNFGSLAGLPPAAMRYTEARLSAVASEMLDDLKRDTVDYVLTYDQRNREPVVLPSRFPNLLVNGSSGIAVGMATSIPPHNLAEVSQAVVRMLEDPEVSIDELMEVLPGPDFPTGGIICGRYGIRQGYLTGRSTLTLRAKTKFITEKNTDIIEVTEIPYLETRDRIREKLEQLVRDDKIKGISRIIDLTDRTTPAWQVCLHIVLKRDADKEVILNQLFQYSPLQSTFSVILLALSGNRPKTMTIKEMIGEFIRHRITVIRRKTEFQLAEARKRKHTIEGLLIAQLNIDEVIQTIRSSGSRAEAKERLQAIVVPSAMVARALGDAGFAEFQSEQGVREAYSLSANQTEAIVSMQLGSLANLEQEKLRGEHQKLIEDILGYLHLLSDEGNIRTVIRDEMQRLGDKYGNARRTEISEEELSDVDKEDLIPEEMMVVTLTQRGYIKRLPIHTYQAQNRGGRGVMGAKADEEDVIQDLFISSTHDWLLFFTDKGRVLWQKVYDLPLQSRTSKGRALVNLLSLQEGEQVATCVNTRTFEFDRYLVMATRAGVVKKTSLDAYKRPTKGGIIAINLKEGDALIEARIVGKQDDILLSTANGMAIRFAQSDARAMGRNTSGVRGIKLKKGDEVIGMVVADPQMTLLTICENGYGKRTPFGYIEPAPVAEEPSNGEEAPVEGVIVEEELADALPEEPEAEESTGEAVAEEGEEATQSSRSYRRQNRGGMGVRDIRTTTRNGKVVKTLAVTDGDHVLLVTAGGKIQRVRAVEISEIGRNTQGVRVIKLVDGDRVASMARIPADLCIETAELPAPTTTTEPPGATTETNLPPTDNTPTTPEDISPAEDASAEE
ncbi:MAG: DNA gyrase subunit A [Planctomyces sp.]|nr:DNA gyrase subunit A [Planctomyces sp.]